MLNKWTQVEFGINLGKYVNGLKELLKNRDAQRTDPVKQALTFTEEEVRR